MGTLKDEENGNTAESAKPYEILPGSGGDSQL